MRQQKSVDDLYMPETLMEKGIAWDAIAGLPGTATMQEAREAASRTIVLRRLSTPIKNWRD